MKGLTRDLLAIARGPFLVLTPAVLFPAMVASYRFSGELPLGLALLILLGGLAAHVAVNALNEYQDFTSGLDEHTARTPFSGGSGTLPEKPWRAGSALWLFLVSFALMIAIGVYLAWRTGPTLITLGVAGGLIILAYTRLINRLPLLCLVSPGTGFGLLMVNGTGLILTGHFPAGVQAVSWVGFFLVNALLLLNQLPDIDADRAVGRRHIPALLGVSASVRVYALLLVGAYGSVLVGWLLEVLPLSALCMWLTLPLAFQVLRQLWRSEGERAVMVPALGKNVMLVIISPLLLGLGLLFG